jgi:hypothetical protein
LLLAFFFLDISRGLGLPGSRFSRRADLILSRGYTSIHRCGIFFTIGGRHESHIPLAAP